MFKILARCAMFLLGAAMVLDIALPTRAEALHVDRHTSSIEYRTATDRANHSGDTSYTLHFAGGELSSCDVGYSAYSKLTDGDAVVVQSTRFFRECFRITKDGELIEHDKHWRLIALIGGGLLIAAAIGWFQVDSDGSIRLS